MRRRKGEGVKRAPAAGGPLGLGRCECGQWAIVLLQKAPLCGVCLPDAMARLRRENEELRRRLSEL